MSILMSKLQYFSKFSEVKAASKNNLRPVAGPYREYVSFMRLLRYTSARERRGMTRKD